MTEQKPHQEPRSGEPAGLARRDHAWDEWAHSLRCDAVVWVTIMAWLSAYRCLVAWPEITSIAPSEALTALLTGARFDSVIATIVILPTVVLGGLSWVAGRAMSTWPLRIFLLWLFFMASALIYAGNHQFYQVMGSQLDQRVLAILSDEDGAVRTTIWEAHNPLMYVALAIVIGVVAAVSSISIARRTRRGRPSGLRNGFAQVTLVIVLFALIVGLIRGFAWGKSPIRIRNA